MKLEDLMINDLVQITEPDDYHGYIGTVKIINSITGYITVFINDENLHDVLIDDLQPIPLTVEILEKSGFTREKWRRNDNFLVITYELDYDIYIELFDHQFRLVHNLEDDPDFGYSTDILVEINFVHQLQHFIKDLEIEKEVIL